MKAHFPKKLINLFKALFGKYSFTLSEYIMYLKFGEYPGYVKDDVCFKYCEADCNLNVLTINEKIFYWPVEEDLTYLSWLYAEVFQDVTRNYHAYEYRGVQINPNDIVYDLGACEGFFCQYALMKKAGKVIAMEPTPRAVEALKKTFSEGININKIEIIPCAAGSHNGIANFSNSVGRIYENRMGGGGINIYSRKLDDLIEPTDRIDFLKMDIEGGEMEALVGAQRILKEQKPKLSIAVYHKLDNAQICKQIIKEANPAYTVIHRGIFCSENELPRPAMVYAW
jgi:FkbM family methyltransferase